MRLELEHRLNVFLNDNRLKRIVVDALRTDGQSRIHHQIAFERTGSKPFLLPWRSVQIARQDFASKAQSTHHIHLAKGTEYELAITVEEMPTSVLDSAAGSFDLDNFARECNALAACIVTDDPVEWLEIARIANCPFLTSASSLVLTGASASILWFTLRTESGARQLRPLSIAGAQTFKRGRRPPLNMSFGDGVVGRVADEQQAMRVSGSALAKMTRSPELVQREGWVTVYAFPLVFDGDTTGVLSLYFRTETELSTEALDSLDAIVPAATLHAARRSRLASIDFEQRALMKGVMRLQSGLTMVGLVHDLARHAKNVHVWASQLREPLQAIALKAGVEATVDDMIKSADLVGSLTASMDSLTLGRQDREGRIEIHAVLEEMKPLLWKLDPRIRVEILGRASIRGPESAIERIVWNLVVNSKNWTTEEDRRIDVRFDRLRSANTATLAVVDNGHGISAERIPVITQPFVSFRENGSGLGLYLVSQLCSQVGAKQPQISSTPYRATTVKIKFLRLLDEVK